jgi:nitroimidazol reductase NimA-like FMN-containing flavoprotein (pyridoxamine 5'-phosphate oxidase superfamily)
MGEEADATGDPTMTPHELEVLDDATAVALLKTRHLGRLAFAHEHWPVILPVNFAFDDPTVIIRTNDGTKLAESPHSAVAFEVDDADPLGSWGWSVLIQGTAFDITDADDDRSIRLRTIEIVTWPAGVRDHWLAVTAVNLTARAFGDVPAIGTPPPPSGPRPRRPGGEVIRP